MIDAGPTDQRRYRRRIIGWGLLVLVVAFVVPAFYVLRWVRDDLERRVPDALAAHGIPGVDASFSGQDGTLLCDVPLADPDGALQIAGDVRGVRTVDLDESCLVGDIEGSTTTPASTSPGPSVVDSTAPATTSPPIATAPLPPDEETIAELIAADPQFAQLSSLLEQTGLDDTVGVGGPFTMLAPTDEAFDEAFDAIGADAFQELFSDPDLLRAVLLHHVAPGLIPWEEFVAGPLTMLDGTTIDVDPGPVGGTTFTSGEIVASDVDLSQVDIDAANGVIHAVDRVILPIGVTVQPPSPVVTTRVDFENGRFALDGVVSSTVQRTSLLRAVQEEATEGNIADELTVDPAASVDDTDIERLARVVSAMPSTLVIGRASLDGAQLTLTGTYIDDEALAALEALAVALDAGVDVSPREEAHDEAAQALQEELNELVGFDPILFESDSTDLTEEAAAVVEDVVTLLSSVDDMVVTIVGHTDSDGEAARNLLISEGRALIVLEALVDAGVPQADLLAEGRGEAELVLDDAGNEDKAASRRVEFVVEPRP